MRFFDFHTHIILKQLFDQHPNIDARVNRNDVTLVPKNCTDLPYIIQSQTHQSQLSEFNDEVIIGAVLYGCESHLADSVKGLQKYLRPDSKHKMSVDTLTAIAADGYSTFTKFTKNLTFDSFVNAPLSFNILKADSFNTPLPKNKVNIFFLIEGCHSLVDTINKIDSSKSYEGSNRYVPEEISKNLDVLLQTAKIVSVNITHMQQSSLCNHAFAIQLTNITHFIPLGSGFTDDGRNVVQKLFDRGICVDLKHMSYKSRLDFRTEYDSGKYFNLQPPLCSHVGFTGIPFSKWTGYIQNEPKEVSDALYLELVKPLQNNNSYFNPGVPAFNLSTINLFDEEIEWVVKKGGMIGLSLDRRILGYVSTNDENVVGEDKSAFLYVDKEYVSKKEWASLGLNGATLGNLIDEDNCVTQDSEDACRDSMKNEYYNDHILLHIQHYFQVCYNAGISIETAQQHITIGSDFDGFINPFINIQTVADISDLKNYIAKKLGYCLDSSEDSKKWLQQLNIPAFVENLFYNNGFNFIKKFFTGK